MKPAYTLVACRPCLPLVMVAILGWLAGAATHAAEVSFVRDVAPILVQRCAGCHGPTKAEGDYRLHTFEFLRNAGASEAAPIVPGQPEASELYRRLVDTDEASRMPQQDDALTLAELTAVKQWIAAGATFDGRDARSSLKSQLPPRTHPAPPANYRVAVPIYAVAFSPDGAELAVGGRHEVTIWDPDRGVVRRRAARLPQRIHALAYTPDGSQLVVGGGTPGDYGELSVMDARGPAAPRVIATFDDIVLAAALSHDLARVAAASADRSVRAFSLADAKPLWRSQLHSDFVTSIGFSHDDHFVVTGSKDFTIKVLDAASGQLFTTYNGHQRQYGEEKGRFAVFAVACAPDRPLIFSAGEGRSIRVWEPQKAHDENGSAADMEERFSKSGHTKYLYHNAKRSVFRLVAAGDQVFATTGDGQVAQFDVATGKLVREYTGHREWVFAADYHPASNRLATGSFDGEVRIWDVATGTLTSSFLGGKP